MWTSLQICWNVIWRKIRRWLCCVSVCLYMSCRASLLCELYPLTLCCRLNSQACVQQQQQLPCPWPGRCRRWTRWPRPQGAAGGTGGSPAIHWTRASCSPGSRRRAPAARGAGGSAHSAARCRAWWSGSRSPEARWTRLHSEGSWRQEEHTLSFIHIQSTQLSNSSKLNNKLTFWLCGALRRRPPCGSRGWQRKTSWCRWSHTPRCGHTSSGANGRTAAPRTERLKRDNKADNQWVSCSFSSRSCVWMSQISVLKRLTLLVYGHH